MYRSQATEAFEADRWRIMRYDRKTGEIVELTRGFDLQVDEMIVSPDSETIYFTAGQRGTTPIFSVPVEPDFQFANRDLCKTYLSNQRFRRFTEYFAGRKNHSF